jgi:hypothetical protein
VNFNEVLIKNRSAVGNILTKFPVHKIVELGKPKAAEAKTESPKKSPDKEGEPELFDLTASKKTMKTTVELQKEKVQMKMEI